MDKAMAYTINGDDTTLDVDAAIGTFAECLGRDDIAGAFDDHRFCAANGRQVLLGHHDTAPVQPGQIIDMGSHTRAGGESGAAVSTVFVTKESNQPRHASNWEELRGLLRDGWVVGTERSLGVKICFVDNGRNYRRDASRILVV